MARLEGLGKLKKKEKENSMTSSGLEPGTFYLVG
jgi:hypothetical protein